MKKYLSILSIVILLASCSKYDEGPIVSLRSKKQRAANTWQVSLSTNASGGDNTDQYLTATYVLNEDGSASFSDTDDQIEASGTWSFTDSKKVISINLSGTNSGQVYNAIFNWKIIRLKEKEMKVEVVENLSKQTLIPVP